MFKFAIMGAAKIAVKFCEAVRLIPECEVVAVASRSKARARAFAEQNQIANAFGSYEEMLMDQEIDCVYIATTPEAHYPLTMLCLNNGTPVLCEKAMFMSSADAERAFQLSREKNVFCMEAMWSRFLPAVLQAKKWMQEGKIGNSNCLSIDMCFAFDRENAARIFDPKLGGGAAYDLTVYGYEIATFFFGDDFQEHSVSATWNEDNIDVVNQITLNYGDKMAVITASCVSALGCNMVIGGDQGRIELPNPNSAMTTRLLDKDGTELEVFTDRDTKNGFIHEIVEAMTCVRAGICESQVASHKMTIDCAKIFDEIYKQQRER